MHNNINNWFDKKTNPSFLFLPFEKKKCDVIVAVIKHEGSRKLKGDNLVGGTVSRRVHNLSDSLEYVGEQQSLADGAEEKAFLPFHPPIWSWNLTHLCYFLLGVSGSRSQE